jgi:hypothetical protein
MNVWTEKFEEQTKELIEEILEKRHKKIKLEQEHIKEKQALERLLDKVKQQ